MGNDPRISGRAAANCYPDIAENARYTPLIKERFRVYRAGMLGAGAGVAAGERHRDNWASSRSTYGRLCRRWTLCTR